MTQSCANRHHALHADLLGPCYNIVQFTGEVWEIKMAMAVCDAGGLDQGRPF